MGSSGKCAALRKMPLGATLEKGSSGKTLRTPESAVTDGTRSSSRSFERLTTDSTARNWYNCFLWEVLVGFRNSRVQRLRTADSGICPQTWAHGRVSQHVAIDTSPPEPLPPLAPRPPLLLSLLQASPSLPPSPRRYRRARTAAVAACAAAAARAADVPASPPSSPAPLPHPLPSLLRAWSAPSLSQLPVTSLAATTHLCSAVLFVIRRCWGCGTRLRIVWRAPRGIRGPHIGWQFCLYSGSGSSADGVCASHGLRCVPRLVLRYVCAGLLPCAGCESACLNLRQRACLCHRAWKWLIHGACSDAHTLVQPTRVTGRVQAVST